MELFRVDFYFCILFIFHTFADYHSGLRGLINSSEQFTGLKRIFKFS